VGSVTMSVHCGTHTDAPFHFIGDGKTIDQCDLHAYIGRALVVDAAGEPVIEPRHVAGLSETPPRILFKTNTARPGEFNESFCYFSVEAARQLCEFQPLLVGIDTPSVDHPHSKTLDAHKTFGAEGVAILENLRLDHVAPGEYELIALPLKLVGLDGSPVRAILRPLVGSVSQE
ncbi:MAG TPA: cyclase family protein, partial [candidate division Zixibacteria bacterium]|nr:cyclase family protein [candidate division Zixibacteria bacterium]